MFIWEQRTLCDLKMEVFHKEPLRKTKPEETIFMASRFATFFYLANKNKMKKIALLQVKNGWDFGTDKPCVFFKKIWWFSFLFFSSTIQIFFLIKVFLRHLIIPYMLMYKKNEHLAFLCFSVHKKLIKNDSSF